MRDPAKLSARTLFWEHETHSAVRIGDWKLVTKNGADPKAWELYKLDSVRTETTNVAIDHPQRVTQMKNLWGDWAKQANVLPWPKERQ